MQDTVLSELPPEPVTKIVTPEQYLTGYRVKLPNGTEVIRPYELVKVLNANLYIVVDPSWRHGCEVK